MQKSLPLFLLQCSTEMHSHRQQFWSIALFLLRMGYRYHKSFHHIFRPLSSIPSSPSIRSIRSFLMHKRILRNESGLNSTVVHKTLLASFVIPIGTISLRQTWSRAPPNVVLAQSGFFRITFPFRPRSHWNSIPPWHWATIVNS